MINPIKNKKMTKMIKIKNFLNGLFIN